MRRWGKPASALVLCLAMLLAGCAASDKPAPVVRPVLRAPAVLHRDCPDPGVTEMVEVNDAIANVTAARLWAVCWKSRARGWDAFWSSVSKGLR